METNKELITDLQNRLQFTIVVVLFFPTFMAHLFSYAKNTTDLPKVGLNWGIILSFFIIIYLFIELIKIYKTPLNKIILKIINWLLLAEIFSFLPLLFISMAETFTNKITIFIYKCSVVASVPLLIFIPVSIIILFMINYYKNHK